MESDALVPKGPTPKGRAMDVHAPSARGDGSWRHDVLPQIQTGLRQRLHSGRGIYTDLALRLGPHGKYSPASNMKHSISSCQANEQMQSSVERLIWVGSLEFAVLFLLCVSDALPFNYQALGDFPEGILSNLRSQYTSQYTSYTKICLSLLLSLKMSSRNSSQLFTATVN